MAKGDGAMRRAGAKELREEMDEVGLSLPGVRLVTWTTRPAPVVTPARASDGTYMGILYGRSSTGVLTTKYREECQP
jgi:hypothetical protein